MSFYRGKSADITIAIFYGAGTPFSFTIFAVHLDLRKGTATIAARLSGMGNCGQKLA